MAISTEAVVTVTTTATLLFDAVDGQGDGVEGAIIELENTGAQDVFIGDSTVATTTGIAVAADATWRSPELRAGDRLYGIVAATTADVRVVAFGV